MKALVVGAGIGGLSAALALAKSGWAVTIFEKSTTIKEVGAAAEYRKYTKKIDKSRDSFGREVLKFYELLRKKGLHDAAGDLLDNYKNNVIKFGKEFKELIRKMI